MARGRMLIKTISYSEKLKKVKTAEACLLYTWLIAHADINGNFYGDADLIKGLVVPARKEFTAESIITFLVDLELQGLLVAYEVGDAVFINIKNFQEMQIRLDKDEKPAFPLFHKEKIVFLGKPTESDGSRRKSHANIIEVNINEVKEQKPLAADAAPKFNALKAFFDTYLKYRLTKYVSTNAGKEGALLKKLAAAVGEASYTLALEKYMKSSDKFIKDNGYNVTTFNTKINAMLQTKPDGARLLSADEVIKQMSGKK